MKKIKCCHCGESVDKEEAIYTNNQWLCEDCYEDLGLNVESEFDINEF